MKTITIITKLIDKLKESGEPITDELQTKIDTLYIMGRLTDEDYMTVCDKQGYKLVKVGENMFEFVKDEESEITMGDYLNPIPYVDEMPVEIGKFYMLEDGNIWECIKTDEISHMTTEWFDIIG